MAGRGRPRAFDEEKVLDVAMRLFWDHGFDGTSMSDLTEAMGINEGDTYVLPKPRETWTRFHSKEEFIEAMDQELSKIPGISHSFTQPMAMRMDCGWSRIPTGSVRAGILDA